MQAVDTLAGDEATIVRLLADRLAAGRHVYGPWRVTDERNYLREALAEIVDALAYCGAQLVRLDRTLAESPRDTSRFAQDCQRIAEDALHLSGPGAAEIRSSARTLAAAVELFEQQKRRLEAETLRGDPEVSR
jgi:hypothetical protein